MKTTVERKSKVRFPVETLAMFAFEGENRPAGRWEEVDIRIQQMVRTASANDSFHGREKQVLCFYPEGGKPAKRIVVAGLGKQGRVDAEHIRRAVSVLLQHLRRVGSEECVLLLPLEQKVGVDEREQAHAAAEAANLTLYRFDGYKSKKENDGSKDPERLRLLAPSDKVAREMEEGVRAGEIYARATCFTRDLINEPAMFATPTKLAEAARQIARGKSGISLKVFDPKQMKKMGMNAVLAVAAGSEQPPVFVHLSYSSPGAKKTIALVGKGITFDSGGLCIKPADGMLTMKDDMSGAAVVLGVFQALGELRPKVHLHGIFAATENMPGGGAYKTGDIVRAMNGKTIEIINTDAEGRVILSDALSYASRLKPDEIIDLATLTGACVVALGTKMSGIFGTDASLVDRLLAASRQAGEKLWPLPLEEEYFELIKSEVADVKNSGGRWAGAITAALLLKEFVDEKISWAHIDMAGECFSDKAEYYKPPGAGGVVVRTLLRYLTQN